MRIISLIWLSCLVAVAVVLPARADCVFCEVPSVAKQPSQYPLNAPLYPFGNAPAVIPQAPSNAAVDRYLDGQNSINSEALSVYKYQQGILGNPGAQQQIMIDETMRDLRLRLQGR